MYLDLEPKVLVRLGRAVGDGDGDPAESLIAAVRPTLHPCADGVGFFAEHLVREQRWRDRGGEETPPFLAVLALLSLVAETMRSDGDFRASNYYGRLALALSVDPDDRRIRSKLTRCFMEESHVLWAALNSWLEDNEGRLGLPTAYAFDYRVHVGIPMSQALVREGDRLALRDLFVAYRLRPGQLLSRSDMLRLLADWLPASGLSAGLKRLCQQRDALERVADVAGIELRAWDGTTKEVREAAGPVAADVLLSAVLRRRPRPRLHLELLVHSLPPLPAGEYALRSGASSHARAALADAGGRLTLEDAGPEGWRSFAESPLVSIPDALFTPLALSNGDAMLRREPRRLLVLEYDEEFRRYVEVNRVQLGRDNMLLCHESLAGQLETTLGPIARPGYRKFAAPQLPGLPQGWIAYEPVEILAISDTTEADLTGLVPLSWAQISLGAGYPLPSRLTWMRGAPPEVRASSLADREVAAALICERCLDGEGFPPRQLARFKGSAVVALDQGRLADGDYRVALSEVGRQATTLGSSAFRIRSADHLRLATDEADSELGYQVGTGAWGTLSASSTRATTPTVRGARVALPRSAEPRASLPAELSIPRELRLVSAVEQVTEEAADRSTTRGGCAPACLIGGAHYWQLPPGGREPWYRTAPWLLTPRWGSPGSILRSSVS